MKHRNETFRRPGFTYMEVLVSMACIILFITAYHPFMNLSANYRAKDTMYCELTRLAVFISDQLTLYPRALLYPESFVLSPLEYQSLTSDSLVLPSLSLEQAQQLFSLKIPSAYLERGYQVLLSRESVQYYTLSYELYHVTVYYYAFDTCYTASSSFLVQIEESNE